MLFVSACIATKNKKYSFNKKYAASKIKDDISLLKKILEANHPSLYWYTSKDSLDKLFETAINSTTDSLTEIQVRNKIAYITSKINCGHTSVRFSKQFTDLSNKNKYPQFPLNLKVWKDSMIVLSRYNINDSILKRGTIITSINDLKNKEIIDSIFQIIASDGYGINFKNQLLSNNFNAWYKTIFGIDSVFKITYLDSIKNEQSISVNSFTEKIDTSKIKTDSLKILLKESTKISKKENKKNKILSYRSLNIDSSINTAFIRLATFSKGRLRKFFRQSFKTIQDKNIKNLVIDLRENGGGSVEKNVLLTKYLKDTAFKIGDTIAARSRSFNFGKHIQGWLPYWFVMQFGTKKMNDGLYHNRYYENHYFNPKIKNHFNGKIFIVQGGYTFSAATMFASSLKNQKNVTIVGEESGGAFYGNSAMLIPNIILPNTKLRVRLPLFKLVMNKDRQKGNGIIPDIEIQPSSDAIRNGVDLKLETIKKIIKEQNISSRIQ